jgi:HlyD family secretion protein
VVTTVRDVEPTEAPSRLEARVRRPLTELIAREERRKRRRRIVLWGILAAVPLLGLGLWFLVRSKPVPLAARFRTAPVERGDLVREIHATGQVEAVTTVQVGAEISGRIASVLVDYNARVRAGQVLARFDRQLLLAQQSQARSALAAALAALEQARTDSLRTARDLVRVEGLFSLNQVSDADHDAAVAAARLAAQKVSVALAQVEAQRGALDVATTNLEHAVIRAPVDGVVITRNIDPGQTVASVLQTPVLFTVAADLRRMRVIAHVDEADIGEVAQGQRATFTVNAWPDRTFEGIVTQVRSSPVIVQDIVTYGTVVELANRDFALKPGMTATVRVRTGSAQDVLHVPNAALTFTPPGQRSDSTPGVWLLTRDGPTRVTVRRGLSDGEATAIAPGPLPLGTSVLTELTPEGRKAYGIRH